MFGGNIRSYKMVIHKVIHNRIISMINFGKLVQHKSNDKFKIFGQFCDEWL